MAIRLVVGLGNPGPEYAQTRHNLGYMYADQCIVNSGATWRSEAKFQGLIAKVDQTLFLKPVTFMNLSGHCVAAVARYYKILPSEILVAHDELDLAVGAVRFKRAGGDAGHHGLENIRQVLGSGDFYRLRLGIGRPEHKSAVADYVLSKPTQIEQEGLVKMLNRIIEKNQKIFRDPDAASLDLQPGVL